MRTKWDILTERAQAAQRLAADLQRQLDGMEGTPCNLNCAACDTILVTEGDFARHFGVKPFDEFNNLLNLGYCPKDKK